MSKYLFFAMQEKNLHIFKEDMDAYNVKMVAKQVKSYSNEFLSHKTRHVFTSARADLLI